MSAAQVNQQPVRGDARIIRHPLVVLRIGCLPSAIIDMLVSPRTSALRQGASEAARTVVEMSGSMLPLLEKRIGTDVAAPVRRVLLDLKRRMHNGRRFDLQAHGDGLGFSTHELSDLQRYLHALDAIDAYRAATGGHEQHDDEMLCTALRRAAEHPDFVHALTYSVPELRAGMEAILSCEPLSAKRQRRLRESLTQYLSRAALKASPLSSFTSIAVTPWPVGGRVENDVVTGRAQGRVSVNRTWLFRQLQKPLRTTQFWAKSAPCS